MQFDNRLLGAIWTLIATLLLTGCGDDTGGDAGGAMNVGGTAGTDIAANPAAGTAGAGTGPAGGSGAAAGTGAAANAATSAAGAGSSVAGNAAAGSAAAGNAAAGNAAAGAASGGTGGGTGTAGTTGASGGSGGTPVETPQAEDQWVSYGNGPQNWFANFGETTLSKDNVADLQLKWQVGSEVTSPPVVVGDRVYVTTADAGLLALNIADGSVIWQDASTSSFSAPTYDSTTETLYVNRWEGGVMHAFDANDGTLRWSMPISNQDAVRGWSSPVVAGGRVVVGIASSDRGTTFKGGLTAFDIALEDVDWTYTHAEAQAAGVSIWGGPAVDLDNNMAFAGSGNNYTLAGAHSDSLFAVDLGTGEMLWNAQMEAGDLWAYDCVTCGPDHDFGTNPILFDYNGRALLAAGQKSGAFWLLDRMTGEVLWQKAISVASHPAYGGVLNNGAFDGTRLLVAGNEGALGGTLYALDPDPGMNGRVIWQRPLSGLVMAPITVANGLAFVSVDRTLEIVDAETGETLRSLPADAAVAGAAAVARGHVFFGCGLSYYDNGAEPGAFYAYGL